MKAILLAGGKGTRLKPYTHVLPKPLVPVGEKPILLLLIETLKNHGIKDFVLCVNHMAELIMSYFGDGKRFGVNIEYSMENNPLGTVGPLKLLKNLPEDFLVMNGDLLTDLDYKEFFKFHCDNKNQITISTFQRQVNIDFGVFDIKENRISSFKEKPNFCFDVSMGIYVFNRKILSLIPANQPFGFDQLMLKMLAENQDIGYFRHKGYWLDIGRPEDFEKANEDIHKLRIDK